MPKRDGFVLETYQYGAAEGSVPPWLVGCESDPAIHRAIEAAAALVEDGTFAATVDLPAYVKGELE